MLIAHSPVGLRATLAAALLGLAGCAPMIPDTEAPPLPVPAQYPLADASQDTGAAQLPWREYFLDPALQALIEQALHNNRDLRGALLRVEEARAAYAIQRSQQFPTLDAQAGLETGRLPNDLTPPGRNSVVTQYQVGVGVTSWEIDFWGGVRSRSQAQLERYLASDAARRALTLELIAQVANAYIGLREIDERLALARLSTDSRAESYRIFSRRYEVGSSSRLTVTEMRTLLTQAQTLSSQLEQERDARAHALQLLVGAPVELPPPGTPLATTQLLGDVRAGLPAELMLDRPDLIAAEHQLRAANADIGAARAAFFPRVSLSGNLRWASGDIEVSSGSGAWSLAPSITLPIFDAGRNQASLDAAQVRSQLALTAYERAIQVAFRDVSDALTARRWLAEQVAIADDALAAQTERARLSRLRYANGAAPFFEVLDAERDLLSAQQQSVQTRRALLSSRIGLYLALGGGSMALPEAGADASADAAALARPTAAQPQGNR